MARDIPNPLPAADTVQSRANPLLSGLALLGLGLLLRRWRPALLTLPDRPRRHSDDQGLPRAARTARDTVAMVMPANLTGSIGRSLMIAGVGLVAIRVLDLLVEDEDALF